MQSSSLHFLMSSLCRVHSQIESYPTLLSMLARKVLLAELPSQLNELSKSELLISVADFSGLICF